MSDVESDESAEFAKDPDYLPFRKVKPGNCSGRGKYRGRGRGKPRGRGRGRKPKNRWTRKVDPPECKLPIEPEEESDSNMDEETRFFNKLELLSTAAAIVESRDSSRAQEDFSPPEERLSDDVTRVSEENFLYPVSMLPDSDIQEFITKKPESPSEDNSPQRLADIIEPEKEKEATEISEKGNSCPSSDNITPIQTQEMMTSGPQQDMCETDPKEADSGKKDFHFVVSPPYWQYNQSSLKLYPQPNNLPINNWYEDRHVMAQSCDSSPSYYVSSEVNYDPGNTGRRPNESTLREYRVNDSNEIGRYMIESSQRSALPTLKHTIYPRYSSYSESQKLLLNYKTLHEQRTLAPFPEYQRLPFNYEQLPMQNLHPGFYPQTVPLNLKSKPTNLEARRVPTSPNLNQFFASPNDSSRFCSSLEQSRCPFAPSYESQRSIPSLEERRLLNIFDLQMCSPCSKYTKLSPCLERQRTWYEELRSPPLLDPQVLNLTCKVNKDKRTSTPIEDYTVRNMDEPFMPVFSPRSETPLDYLHRSLTFDQEVPLRTNSAHPSTITSQTIPSPPQISDPIPLLLDNYSARPHNFPHLPTPSTMYSPLPLRMLPLLDATPVTRRTLPMLQARIPRDLIHDPGKHRV